MFGLGKMIRLRGTPTREGYVFSILMCWVLGLIWIASAYLVFFVWELSTAWKVAADFALLLTVDILSGPFVSFETYQKDLVKYTPPISLKERDSSGKTPIAVLTCKRRERRTLLLTILSSLVMSKYETIIISKRRTRKLESARESEGYNLYSIATMMELDSAVELLLSASEWHRNSFRIVIGPEGLSAAISGCQQTSLGDPVPSIAEAIDIGVIGYIVPVDEELIVYGDEGIESLLKFVHVVP